MSTNENIMLEFYSLGKEDSRATLSRSSSLEFYYTKKHLEIISQLYVIGESKSIYLLET